MRALFLFALALSLPAAERDPRVGDVDPVLPAEKVERALNGTFAFPPSPEVAWAPDAAGFAHDRLYRVPAPGIHPRILFAPEDLPRIRETMATPVGKAKIAALRALVAKGLGTPSTYEGRCWTALVAGDVEAFGKALQESPLDNVPPGSGFKMNLPGRIPATKWGPRHPVLASLQAKAFLAQIDANPVAGREVAVAVDTWARFTAPRVAKARQTPRQEFHWVSTRDLVPNEMAFAYDWSWTWMDQVQRDRLRSLFVAAIVGTYTVGMDLPRHWRVWNHLAIDNSYLNGLFVIEGEPGDDPRGRERFFEVLRDYITYSHTPRGFAFEGIGYHTAGYAHLTTALVSFANRGQNLITHPHFRRLVDTWFVHTLQPFGGAWVSSGDLGNFPPNLAVLQFHKWFFPEDPGVDFVLRNHPQARQTDVTRTVAEDEGFTWITTAMPGEADTRAAATAAAAARTGGGLTWFEDQRGSLYTRTGWGPDDLVLHVDCRTDITFPSHDHPDRGQFTLAALGRAWACDGYRDTESKFHNVVTIDGRGQSYFPPPGRWIAHEDTAQATTAIIDAKYNWDWQWTKSLFTESAASLQRRGQEVFTESAQRALERVPLEKWEVDPLPQVTAYYQGFATRANGDPRMWDDEDGWQLRAPWYPVQKAFRTVTLARGPRPYVLVMDDIRKDDAEHLYEWRMNAGPDVEAVSIAGNDILLGDQTTRREVPVLNYGFQGKSALAPAKGDRLLLVRTLDIAVPDLPTLHPIPVVATVEYKKSDDMHQFTGRTMGLGTQVVIGSRSVEPRFLVMLYPHRQGEALPETSWNADRTQLTVRWPEGQQVWDVTTGPDGRRRLAQKP